ncbi:MAG: tRNA (5-methylaminomethyl-2-thiouridine)(34)-methyltransferase MnmD [Alphaproteobacteria bacterium]
MSVVPRSEQFDDVYFSAQDGLEETRHVFLAGNGLPDAWAGREVFTICETGFGTGLNFLAVLQLLAQGVRPDNLHFISFEKYPLTGEYIAACLAHWGELKNELGELLSVYPVDISGGTHVLEVMNGVRLTLIFGDVNDEIPKLQESVDCWFLDGFKPSSNPDMWSETVFANMARLSCQGASLATFTSAGFVRRGLQAAGFDIQKIRGFGRKREMCVGYLIQGDEV